MRLPAPALLTEAEPARASVPERQKIPRSADARQPVGHVSVAWLSVSCTGLTVAADGVPGAMFRASDKSSSL